jgi:predicted glycosyltransferase
MKVRNKKGTIVCGKPQEQMTFQENDISIVTHLQDEALSKAIRNAEVIVCRSGYSTLMDLYALNRKAYLLPTPGQREQIYLAQYWTDHLGMRIFDPNGEAEAFD